MGVISIADDAVILDNDIRLKFLRDAEYSPAPPLVGMLGDEQTLLQCTSDGKLLVEASLTVESITIGSVQDQAQDALGHFQFLQVETDPVTSRYALLTNDPRLTFTGTALNVNVAAEADTATQVAKYDDTGVSPIAGGGSGTIVSYTVPAGKTFNLRHASASGDNIAEYTLKVNGSPLVHKRTWFTDYNAEFFFESNDGGGYVGNAGDIFTLEVSNFRPTPGDFNGTIFGRTE